MKQISEISEYLDIVSRYRQKGCRSNDYIQQSAAELIAQGRLFFREGQSNVFFFVKNQVGQRIYYYINDLSELFDFETDADLVTEILFREDLPQNEMDFFIKNGFRVNLIRDQYAALYKDMVVDENLSLKIEAANSIEDVVTACKLFNASFDNLSGDFISAECYETLFKEHQILIAKGNGSFLGAIHQGKEGSTNVIGHLAVTESARGKGVGSALVNTFIQRNYETEKSRYMLWVQRQNVAAINMYKKFGFKFINKSTVSLTLKR